MIDFVAVGCFVIAALGMAAGQALKADPAMFEVLPPFFGSPRWAYVPIVLLTIGGAIWGLKQLGWIGAPKMEDVYRKTFDSEIVTLDYKAFFDCTFKNVTFRYNGGPWNFVNAKFEGQTRIETLDPNVRNAIDFLKFQGFLREDFAKSWQILPNEHFNK